MSRERVLILYCVLVGSLGWLWLLFSGPFGVPASIVALFLIVALLVEIAGFRVPPSDPHSLVGIVLITAALALGPPTGALVAAVSGLLFGLLLPIIYPRPRTFYMSVARPYLRGGVRALAILLGAALAQLTAGGTPDTSTLLVVLIISYVLVVQLNRATREYLQGGRTGVATWWRSAWRSILSAEVAPLPLAWLALAIYERLGLAYFLLGAAGLLASSLTLRRAALSLQRQRRSVRELSVLNQVSRAIIGAEMNVTSLCDPIYREASKVVDTASFHLGLFEPEGDSYTLVVRVQDRVRLPPLVVQLPAGDGIIGWMRETGRGLLVHDFTAEMEQLPARPRYQSARPPRSGIYVPLTVGEQVIGTISIQSYRPRAFDVNDMQTLSLIADQAAVAIAKARAFAQANQRAVQLQAIREVSERITAILDLEQLLDSVVALIRERFGYHPVHIFTLEPGQRLIFQASTADDWDKMGAMALRVGDGIVGQAAAQVQPLLINDTRTDPRYISDDANTRSELAVPLRFGDACLGVLDLQSAEVGRFTDGDLFVMQTLADQIAVAIESARAFTAQREEAWTLNALLQVSENLARATTLDELLPTIVRLPPLLLGCDRCYCLVWNPQHATYTPLAAYGLTHEQRAQFVGHTIAERDGAPLLADARRTATFVAVNDAASQPDICPQIIHPFGSGALLVLPLTARGAPLGLLVADYQDPAYPLQGRMLTLYTGIANQIAGALESALLAQEAAEAAHLEEELRVARDIQTALLPASEPHLPGWQISAAWRAARLVGGDFYDFWHLEPTANHRPPTADAIAPSSVVHRPSSVLGFVIADVSDKGVPAAMFMALSRSLVRAAALDGSRPSVALERANRWITRDSESGMFVTLFYGVLDPANGMLHYTCAGHNPPLLVRQDASVSVLTTPGIALGVLEEVRLGEAEVQLQPGDVLVCYTDGITEAINTAEEVFGVPRLIEIAVAHRQHPADVIANAILDDLTAFIRAGPPFDDITLVVLKREEIVGTRD